MARQLRGGAQVAFVSVSGKQLHAWIEDEMAATIEPDIPRYLYRYRKLSGLRRRDREIASMQEQYLWCGGFSELNDPMEGQFRASRRAAYDRLIRDQKSETGICSFSETPDNELMWAHYADQFRGVCIEYDFEQLRDDLECGSFVRMQYTDKLTRLNAFHEPFSAARKLLHQKNGRWVYEREWRLLTPQIGRIPYANAHRRRQPITRIFIGSKAPQGIGQLLSESLPGVPLYPMLILGYRIRFADFD